MHVYLPFAKQVYGSAIKCLCPSCHIEMCKGSEEQNITYGWALSVNLMMAHET